MLSGNNNQILDDRVVFFIAEMVTLHSTIWIVVGAHEKEGTFAAAFVLFMLGSFVAFESRLSLARARPRVADRENFAREAISLLVCAFITFGINTVGAHVTLFLLFPYDWDFVFAFVVWPAFALGFLLVVYLLRAWVFAFGQ